MAGRSGVFVKVKSKHKLADPGRKPGAMVLLLACGHARTINKAGAGKRAWCKLCSEAQVRQAEVAVPKGFAVVSKRELTRLKNLAARHMVKEAVSG